MTIPDDVMKTATFAYEELDGVCTNEFHHTDIDIIARAIMADRKSRWRPIETAPKDGNKSVVDLWAMGTRFPSCYFDGVNWRQWGSGHIVGGVTHWMPLPTPPTGGDNEAKEAER